MARKAETLDDLLLHTGETYDAFAERAGVTRRALLSLRLGQVENPRRATLLALAVALKVDVERVRAACEASRAAAK